MTTRTWVILGATSIIAEHFAHLVAQSGDNLRLVGRDRSQLEIIAQDIQLRYQISCEIIIIDMAKQDSQLLTVLNSKDQELDLFIAHSDFTENNNLNAQSITQLIEVNILATSLLIHTYLNMNQKKHNLIYLSSVAACRGRFKNSLYGGSKAAIETYLQGLQQAASENQNLLIARLGFIDTKQTYGVPGVFYAAPTQDCAKACWKALKQKKRLIYFPFFWRIIMGVVTRIPFFLFKPKPRKNRN
jgi:short-subunit dehydrogenase